MTTGVVLIIWLATMSAWCSARLAAALDALLAYNGDSERPLEDVLAVLEQEVAESEERFKLHGLVRCPGLGGLV